MGNSSKRLGQLGEAIACRYLADRGYKILVRNYTCLLGELDLIARKDDVLIFVEVKARRSTVSGEGYESVHAWKRHKLIQTAQSYLKRYGMQDVACRFDVISILFNDDRSYRVELIADAFWGLS